MLSTLGRRDTLISRLQENQPRIRLKVHHNVELYGTTTITNNNSMNDTHINQIKSLVTGTGQETMQVIVSNATRAAALQAM